MGRHNKNGRPVAGGGRDPTDGKDRDDVYSEPERRASLSLAYIQPEWMGQLDRHPEPPKRATRWRSNGKVIRVDMKPDGWRIRQVVDLFEVCKFMPSCVPSARWLVLGTAPSLEVARQAIEMLLKEDKRPVWPEVLG